MNFLNGKLGHCSFMGIIRVKQEFILVMMLLVYSTQRD